MGEAYTAAVDDVNALYYNPAGLSRVTRRELGATHTQWLQETKFDFLGFAQPTTFGTLGLGLSRLASGSFDGRGGDREASGNFEASDTAYTLGLSRTITHASSLGVNVKYLESRIGAYSASAVAFDLGATHKLSQTVSLGASVLNLGQGMRFLDQTDPLPLTVAVGGAVKLISSMNLALDIAQDVHNRKTDVRVGTEYAVLGSLSFRTGYVASAASRSGNPLGNFGAGFGLKLGRYQTEYAFSPFGELGNVQRISLGMKF